MAMQGPREKVKRKYIRFTDESSRVATISLDLEEFSPDFTCLIDTEAMGGCGLTLNKKNKFFRGQVIQVAVGQLPITNAKIAWVKAYENDLFRLGLEYEL